MRLVVVQAAPGATAGAKVVDCRTGEEVEDVACVSYVHRAGEVARVVVELRCVDRHAVLPHGTEVREHGVVYPRR